MTAAAAAVGDAAVAAAVAVSQKTARDRVGLGWRAELAAGILSNLARIDVLEVIADDYYGASRAGIAALCSLARQIPVSLHGVGMGLASTIPAEPRRLHAMARLMQAVQAESWSEHLSFVRAGGIEIGHLAAPPRTPHSAAGAIANIALATRIVGSAPLMENIATLVQPPASTMDEAEWVAQIIHGAQVPLLLDLHNLYANAVNAGEAPQELLLRLPLAVYPYLLDLYPMARPAYSGDSSSGSSGDSSSGGDGGGDSGGSSCGSGCGGCGGGGGCGS